MATLCIRVVGPSIFLTSMTAEAARVDSCHTGAIVMVGLDFEFRRSGTRLRHPQGHILVPSPPQVWSKSRGGDTNFGSPRGAPSLRWRPDRWPEKGD